jgi:hypothetical protein
LLVQFPLSLAAFRSSRGTRHEAEFCAGAGSAARPQDSEPIAVVLECVRTDWGSGSVASSGLALSLATASSDDYYAVHDEETVYKVHWG